LDQEFARHWSAAFPGADAPSWSLRDIELIAGDLFFGVKPLQNPTGDGTNAVMFGAPFMVLRWRQPLAGQFAELSKIPGAEMKEHQGTAYVELPLVPALGPTNMGVCQWDDHSLLVAQNHAILSARLDQRKLPPRERDWQSSWKAVDGGLAAFVATDANVQRPLGPPVDQSAATYSNFLAHARVHAFGLDWQPKLSAVTAAKMQFRFETEAAAGAIDKLIPSVMERMAEISTNPDASGQAGGTSPAAPHPVLAAVAESLRRAKRTTRQDDGQWLVELLMAGQLDYASLWAR
jgi:hypothetical protein